MKAWLNKLCVACMLLLTINTQTYANDSPPHTITSVDMAVTIGKHYLDYTHYKPIGICTWLHWWMFMPYIVVTPELDEHLPDLIISVYNKAGDNPWFEARQTIDKVAKVAGNAAIRAITGFELTNGRNTSIRGKQHNSANITKTVDVIGSPMDLLKIPYLTLQSDTTSFMPYFQSNLDVATGRMGIAEALRIETWNPIGHYIGSSFINHWAYEFPRDMTVDNNNDYKASVSIALHAADIVTNQNTLHVVKSVADSCGTNCAVSNVTENAKQVIWQEIYPHDRRIQIGKSDVTSITPIGSNDTKAGHGNYIFVLWRHYRGCVQSPGGEDRKSVV